MYTLQQGGNTFVPDVVLAEAGDTILFQFYPTNHSVIRAEYGYPCIPYEDTGVDKVGFFSGFKPVDAILPNPPTWSLLINDTDPVFYYCGAPGSCINYQMVGVINPNATTSLQHQKDLASESSFLLLPGEPWPSEETDPFSSSSTTAASTAAPTSSPTTTASGTVGSGSAVGSSNDGSQGTAHSSSGGLSKGAIAGVAIGAAAVALAAGALLYLCGRREASSRSRRQQQREQQYFDDHHHQQPGLGQAPNMQSMPYSNHNSMHHPSMAGPYNFDPSKHMSMHSGGVSPALPGYVPQHDPTMSPPLHPTFPVSDSLSPGGGVFGLPAGAPSPPPPPPPVGGDNMLVTSSNNPSPNQGYSAPAYSSGVPHNM